MDRRNKITQGNYEYSIKLDTLYTQDGYLYRFRCVTFSFNKFGM